MEFKCLLSLDEETKWSKKLASVFNFIFFVYSSKIHLLRIVEKEKIDKLVGRKQPKKRVLCYTTKVFKQKVLHYQIKLLLINDLSSSTFCQQNNLSLNIGSLDIK